MPNIKQRILSITNIHIKLLNGSPLKWNELKNKKLLFVNVASECGFTPQYHELQKLYDEHKDHLEVIGMPCNDFGGQEPGSPDEIQSFCELNYGVSFPITEKINIINDPHPLISYLCDDESEPFKIDWNFNKILVDENGKVLDRFRSSVGPLDEKILNKLK